MEIQILSAQQIFDNVHNGHYYRDSDGQSKRLDCGCQINITHGFLNEPKKSIRSSGTQITHELIWCLYHYLEATKPEFIAHNNIRKKGEF